MTIFTNRFKTIILASSVAIIGVPSVNAVVAKPGLYAATQPDGSTVTIRQEGGFGNHRTYSADGYLLTTNDEGFYVFADCDADGLPVATSIRALDVEKRSPEMKIEISKLDQSRVSDAFMRRSIQNNKKTGKARKGPGLFSTHFPSTGEQHSIAILVNFSNKEFTMEDPNDYYTRQLNEEGFNDNGATGSAREYFIDNSYGNFKPTFDVYGPVTLSHPYAYYGANNSFGEDKRPHEMVIDACLLLDDEVDFSKYDRNGDGVIDNVYIYYAGYGEADGGGSNTIWPHSYDLEYLSDTEYVLDGVILNHYACSNELDHVSDIPSGIGTFTHEFSHVMGLPDLYPTAGSSAFTPGEWNIMDVGSYNNCGCTPPNYSSFERYALGWLEPEILTEVGDYTLEPLPQSNKAFLIPTELENEYFLLENRQHMGNDRFIPGHGMLVWHVDFNQEIWDQNVVNNDNRHQHMDLVEADNERKEKSRAGDSFPGSAGITAFGEETEPALLSWAKVSPGIDLYDIAESEEGIISFSVKQSSSAGVESVTGFGSTISVNGRFVTCNGGSATVYDFTGKKVTEVSSNPVALQPGLYIIVAGAQKRKVVIK